MCLRSIVSVLVWGEESQCQPSLCLSECMGLCGVSARGSVVCTLTRTFVGLGSGVCASVLEMCVALRRSRIIPIYQVRVWVRISCVEVGVVDAAQLGCVGVVDGPVRWLVWGGSCVCRDAVGLRLALSQSFVQVAPKFHFIISFFFAQISRKFWRNLVV